MTTKKTPSKKTCSNAGRELKTKKTSKAGKTLKSCSVSVKKKTENEVYEYTPSVSLKNLIQEFEKNKIQLQKNSEKFGRYYRKNIKDFGYEKKLNEQSNLLYQKEEEILKKIKKITNVDGVNQNKQAKLINQKIDNGEKVKNADVFVIVTYYDPEKRAYISIVNINDGIKPSCSFLEMSSELAKKQKNLTKLKL